MTDKLQLPEKMKLKSIQELEYAIQSAMNDLAAKVCFKEGYNQAIKEVNELLDFIFKRPKV